MILQLTNLSYQELELAQIKLKGPDYPLPEEQDYGSYYNILAISIQIPRNLYYKSINILLDDQFQFD